MNKNVRYSTGGIWKKRITKDSEVAKAEKGKDHGYRRLRHVEIENVNITLKRSVSCPKSFHHRSNMFTFVL